MVLALSAVLPSASRAQQAGEAKHQVASLEHEWPDLHARLIAMERVLSEAVDRYVSRPEVSLPDVPKDMTILIRPPVYVLRE